MSTAHNSAGGHDDDRSEPVAGLDAEPGSDGAQDDAVDDVGPATGGDSSRSHRRVSARTWAFTVLPVVIFAVTMGSAWLKWDAATSEASARERTDSVAAAKATTMAMLAYEPNSVEQTLNAAQSLLTGQFRDEYSKLVKDVVIPGAQQKKITTMATVTAAGAVSADPNNAVVLLFVDQSVTIGDGVPTASASVVRVSLQKQSGRWLVSKFEPI